MARYKPSTAKYRGKVKTLYLTYEQTWTHNYRGHRKKRTQIRVKRIYVPGKLKSVSRPGVYTNRKGRRVYGVKVTYVNPIKGGAGRGHRIKQVTVTKVIPLPRNAKKVKVRRSRKGLAGPLMAIT